MKRLLIICCSFFYLTVTGQSAAEEETSLLEKFKKISYLRLAYDTSHQPPFYDSLDTANENFLHSLLLVTTASPLSITYPYLQLQSEGLHIVTSADGLFRIYSWDRLTGGTMQFHSNVFQYKSGGRVYSKTIDAIADDQDPGCWYNGIQLLKTSDNTWYLAQFAAKYSNRDFREGIKAFQIKNDSLQSDVKLIKTSSGLQNELAFTYDFFTVTKRLERPVKLFSYNTRARIISIPLVKENGEVTNRSIQYIFTGQYFERKRKGN